MSNKSTRIYIVQKLCGLAEFRQAVVEDRLLSAQINKICSQEDCSFLPDNNLACTPDKQPSKPGKWSYRRQNRTRHNRARGHSPARVIHVLRYPGSGTKLFPSWGEDGTGFYRFLCLGFSPKLNGVRRTTSLTSDAFFALSAHLTSAPLQPYIHLVELERLLVSGDQSITVQDIIDKGRLLGFRQHARPLDKRYPTEGEKTRA